MFVQLIQGPVTSSVDLKRQLDRWDAEVRPGAVGFLGSTAGVTGDGTALLAARFDTAEHARANSDRPEQSGWWNETEKCFTRPVIFTDSSDVQVVLEPRNDARFVQVIMSRVLDRKRVEALNDRVATELVSSRPEIIGSVVVWSGNRACDLAYFTDEASARAGESRELPPEHKALFQEWRSLITEVTYLDLTDPWLT